MVTPPWESLARGIECPYDAPRPANTEYFDLVAKLSISSLCLTKNQTYRGSCVLIFDPRHVTRIDQLSTAEWSSFSNDLLLAEAAIVRAMRPDHMNVALLGNTIPHLHWGIVPRYRRDPRWGMPIWMTSRSEMADVRLSVEDHSALVMRLQRTLAV